VYSEIAEDDEWAAI
jgi:Fe-S cluster biosynthesis and repair protein YggX